MKDVQIHPGNFMHLSSMWVFVGKLQISSEEL